MILLLIFSFLAGIVTVLSPCILPLLPLILTASDGKQTAKPYGVVIGFIASFTFFTLFLASIVRVTGVPADLIRTLSVIVLACFGVALLLPKLQTYIEIMFSRVANRFPKSSTRPGLIGGILVGFSLGLAWTPCVGPILASVITLAISGSVTWQAGAITLAYAIGTALPMLLIMRAGSTALQKVPWLLRLTPRIQQVFGVVMIATAAALWLGIDREFQIWFLQTFPTYAGSLTRFENTELIRQALEK